MTAVDTYNTLQSTKSGNGRRSGSNMRTTVVMVTTDGTMTVIAATTTNAAAVAGGGDGCGRGVFWRRRAGQRVARKSPKPIGDFIRQRGAVFLTVS